MAIHRQVIQKQFVDMLFRLQNTLLSLRAGSMSYRSGSRGDWGDRPLKPTKVTLFSTILYNSENNIHDVRPVCCRLFCHILAVKNHAKKYTSSVLQQSNCYETWPTNIIEIAPLKLTGWIRPWCHSSNNAKLDQMKNDSLSIQSSCADTATKLFGYGNNAIFLQIS